MQSEDKTKKEDLLCKRCMSRELDWGKTTCEKHGNEFIDWKCMYCCSITLFICGGGSGNYCTPCHNDAMAGRLAPKSECVGGDECPLKIPKHPKADRDPKKARFALGCSICRSDKLDMIADNQSGGTGANLERRGSMLKRFGGVHGHDINRELRAEGPRRP